MNHRVVAYQQTDTRKLVVQPTRTVLGARDLAVSAVQSSGTLYTHTSPGSITIDYCYVCQALKNVLVFSPGLKHPRIIYFALYAR